MSATGDELIETCDKCGGTVDANQPGHYKSPSEVFFHKVCYENGVPEEPVLDLSEHYPHLLQIPHQYQCGHYAHGPPRKLPGECPECSGGSDE